MKLTERIRADLTEAMKARQAERLSTLRMLQAAIKNEQIAKGHELTDEDVLAVIQRGVKQRQDSIEQYTKGNRPELAARERAELEQLQAYLPAQMSDEELERAVREIIAETGASSKKDSGKVMKEMMARYRGQVDGKRVQEVVGRTLV
jgi:uncharacterized protein